MFPRNASKSFAAALLLAAFAHAPAGAADYLQYDIEVGDSTSSPRAATDPNKKVYPDTRKDGATGVGIGTLRLYKDVATGQIAGYTWTAAPTRPISP